MLRSKWLFSLLAIVPLLATGAWAGSQAFGNTREVTTVVRGNPCGDSTCPLCETGGKNAAKTDCCDDPTCPPGCSADCTPDCLDLKVSAKTTKTAKTECCPQGECCPAGACCPATAKTAVKKEFTCPPCPFCPGW